MSQVCVVMERDVAVDIRSSQLGLQTWEQLTLELSLPLVLVELTLSCQTNEVVAELLVVSSSFEDELLECLDDVLFCTGVGIFVSQMEKQFLCGGNLVWMSVT